MKAKTKRRLLFIALTVVTILGGLASRWDAISLPVFAAAYAGDTLWALMVFWGFCIFAPGAKTWKVGLAAIAFSYAIELSQFYHAPWIDGLRNTTLGGLVLGFGFKRSDLVCYSVGVIIGVIIHWLVTKNQSEHAIEPK
jgi:hypothetical protein